MTLPIGTDALSLPNVDLAPVAELPEVIDLTALPGPRDDMFAPDALTTLAAAPYTVTQDCDRVGVRLDGRVLRRQDHTELPSEGVVRGAIEIPPNGQPILFLVDHLTTCGYPVIAVVDEDCLDLAAQARPGQHIRFHILATKRFF
jgi:allophanate hydrolase subunit 2